MQANKILESQYPKEIAEVLTSSYVEIENNFRLGKWKASELDAGHFVESALRIIEYSLFGACTPLSQKFGSFNDAVLKRFEQATGEESLRLIIPRVLFGVYCIRNKRGVGHIGSVSANEMDAIYILYSAKWVLAEFIRLCAKIAPKEAEDIVKRIAEREIEAVWDDGETFMILEPKLKLAEKILIALYKKDDTPDNTLQALVVYSNRTRFKAQLKKLNQELLIDYRQDGRCKISPLGVARAEAILTKL